MSLHTLRHAVRQLRRTPAYTATAIVVLALAVGAAAIVLALVDGLLLRELPVPAPRELVQIGTRDARGRTGVLTWKQFTGFLERQQAFITVIGSIAQGMATAERERGTLRVSVAGVMPNYFAELGAVPALGRFFAPSEIDLPSHGGAPVAVLGWSCWQRDFDGDPTVIGRTLRVQGVPVTIIGIAPAQFHGLGLTIENDVAVPLTVFPQFFEGGTAWFDGPTRWVSATGRLRPGVTLDAASAQIATLWPAVRDDATPAGLEGSARDDYRALQVQIESAALGLEPALRTRYRPALAALLAIAALLVILAAVNLGSLAFVRTESTRQELAIHLALGASRLRVVRECTMQGLLVGAAAAVGAVICGAVGADAIAGFMLRDYQVPTSLDVSPSLALVLITMAVSLLTGATMTAVAAWTATAPGRVGLIAGGNRAVARSSRLGRVLVAAQAALAVVVLANVSLLGANLQRLSRQDPAITRESVLIGTPLERPGAYRTLDPGTYYEALLARITAVPGVTAAAFSQHRPQWDTPTPERLGRTATPASTADPLATTTLVSPAFFATMGLPILQGRDFTFADRDGAARVAIVSRTLARELFDDDSAVGRHIRLGETRDLQEVLIVGVAGDARVFNVRDRNVALAYRPTQQGGRRALYRTLVVRAPASATRAIQDAVNALGVESVGTLQTLDEARGRALRQERIMAMIGTGLGAIALALVAAGLYGLLAYILSLRRKEMGIRMALGADGFRIGASMLRQGLSVAGAGVTVGLAAAWLSRGLLRSTLTAVSPSDPLPVLAGCGVLIVVTLLAALGPVVRAARLQPLVELRRE